MWRIEVDRALVDSLEASLDQGPIVDNLGRRLLTEAKVGVDGGLKFEIFANEHPPPHFRVSYQGETANFTIHDCRKINGGLDRFSKNIRQWYQSNRDSLIRTWNERRPTDCPVGVIPVSGSAA